MCPMLSETHFSLACPSPSREAVEVGPVCIVLFITQSPGPGEGRSWSDVCVRVCVQACCVYVFPQCSEEPPASAPSLAAAQDLTSWVSAQTEARVLPHEALAVHTECLMQPSPVLAPTSIFKISLSLTGLPILGFQIEITKYRSVMLKPLQPHVGGSGFLLKQVRVKAKQGHHITLLHRPC